jgi:hypothetical protein
MSDFIKNGEALGISIKPHPKLYISPNYLREGVKQEGSKRLRKTVIDHYKFGQHFEALAKFRRT